MQKLRGYEMDPQRGERKTVNYPVTMRREKICK